MQLCFHWQHPSQSINNVTFCCVIETVCFCVVYFARSCQLNFNHGWWVGNHNLNFFLSYKLVNEEKEEMEKVKIKRTIINSD